MTLSQVAVRIALARVAAGIKERGGRNRGPEVDSYARAVGLDPVNGYAWCTSGLYDVFREATAELGLARCPFPRTAKAVSVFARCPAACLRPNPAVGLVYVLDHGTPGDVLTEWRTNRYKDDGHIGIVVAVNDTGAPIVVELPDLLAALLGVPGLPTSYTLAPGDQLEVSGNTNAEGSREGDRWAIHHGTPEASHGGMLLSYIDMDAWSANVVA